MREKEQLRVPYLSAILSVGKLFYCERCTEVEASLAFYKRMIRKSTNNELIKLR